MPDPGFLVDAFGLGRPAALNQVARGAMGAVWRLEVAGTTSYAAKELFWDPPDEERVAAEVELVERCRVAGVRSQRAVAGPDGRFLVLDPGGERWWRLYEWVDGRTPDRQHPVTAGWLVQQLGRIHRAGVPGCDYTPGDVWYHRIDADWDRLVADASRARMPWAPRLAEAVPRLLDLSAVVDGAPVGPGLLSHRDLNGSNTVLDDAGRHWLIDWDNFGPLEPWRELGALLTEHLDDTAGLEQLARTYAAEGSAIGCPPGPELFATGLAVWLNFLAGQAHGALDDGGDAEHRAWSTARVDGLIGRFPARSDLGRAAEVVAGVLARA